MKEIMFEAGKTYCCMGGDYEIEVVKRTRCYVWFSYQGHDEIRKRFIEHRYYLDENGDSVSCEILPKDKHDYSVPADEWFALY